MNQPIQSTDFHFPYHFQKYQGKVRDVYTIENYLTLMVVSDRISAFDIVFPQLIPDKGQILNEIAAFFLRKTSNICPNYLLELPHPNISIGLKCEPYPIEFIIRARLCGHAWRLYQSGKREVCGVALPNGLKENDLLPEPILTPTTKSVIGHDIDVTEKEITKSGLIDPEEFARIKYFAFAVFNFGQEWAKSKGLILADAKFEFGSKEFDILLIDEILTPDSSRYFWADGFEERHQQGEAQPQFSKEHLRKWLIQQGFQGEEGSVPPDLTQEIVMEVRQKYVQVFEALTGESFSPNKEPIDSHDNQEKLLASLKKYLK